jgi:hypothetical protein
MIAIILLLVALEIWWDWRLIEKKQRSPNYRGSNWLRVIVGTVLWCMWPVVSPSIGHIQWLYSPVMTFCVFWFVFDYGLNKARDKPLMYLGWRAMDLWQRENGGLTVWFWTKLALAVGSVVVYYLI